MPIADPLLAILAGRRKSPSPPNATLATMSDGTVRWVAGSAGQVWTLDDQAAPGWRKLPLLGSVPYRPDVPDAPPLGSQAQVSVASLVALTAGYNDVRADVMKLRDALQAEIEARNALVRDLIRVGLIAPK